MVVYKIADLVQLIAHVGSTMRNGKGRSNKIEEFITQSMVCVSRDAYTFG